MPQLHVCPKFSDGLTLYLQSLWWIRYCMLTARKETSHAMCYALDRSTNTCPHLISAAAWSGGVLAVRGSPLITRLALLVRGWIILSTEVESTTAKFSHGEKHSVCLFIQAMQSCTNGNNAVVRQSRFSRGAPEPLLRAVGPLEVTLSKQRAGSRAGRTALQHALRRRRGGPSYGSLSCTRLL